MSLIEMSECPKPVIGSTCGRPFAPPVMLPGLLTFVNEMKAWAKKSVTIAR
jgi:hypothetical protein